jgi:hypothetical protein
MCLCYYHCFDGSNKEMALFISLQIICDRKYSLYSSTSTKKGKREFQNELCVVFNEIHSLRTISNISDHFSKVVRDSVFIHPSWFYLCLQYEQIHMIRNTFQFFKNLLYGERGQDIYYKDSHFVRRNEKFSSCNLLVTEDEQSMDRKEWLCFIVWNVNSPSSAAVIFTLIGYSFFGKIRRCFLQKLLFSAAIACFLFLICCSISELLPCSIENCDLQVEDCTIPIC